MSVTYGIGIIWACLTLLTSSTNALRVGQRSKYSVQQRGKKILSMLSGESYENVEKQITQLMKENVAQISQGKDNDQLTQAKNSILHFIREYLESSESAGYSTEKIQNILTIFVKEVLHSINEPYPFPSHHVAIRKPVDYYSWGNDFFRPLIIEEKSKISGLENANTILKMANAGENVVILSNHQTEADPQVISLLLERYGMNELAERIVFVAGHKVTTDPIAIPFSKGRNLICIHSKKYIQHPPELFAQKQAQNIASIKALNELATKGGNVFWVAPSGGRDRPNPESGDFVVAPFDNKVVSMFQMIGRQSKRPMHLYPMAMFTNQLVPPPTSTSSAIGETRSAKRGQVSVCFLPEYIGKDSSVAGEEVHKLVEEAYQELCSWHELRTSE